MPDHVHAVVWFPQTGQLSRFMPNGKRAFVPGGTFFFTVVTQRRAPFLCESPARRLLTSLIRRCRWRWPMRINALVLLPDHGHTIWSLPPGDAASPRRVGWIKQEFTKAWLQLGGQEQRRTAGQIHDGRRAAWPSKSWEHTIESPEDFEKHFDDIHYHPVKHGDIRCPHEWPWSTFHRWVAAAVYARHWACWNDESKHLPIPNIDETTGKP